MLIAVQSLTPNMKISAFFNSSVLIVRLFSPLWQLMMGFYWCFGYIKTI